MSISDTQFNDWLSADGQYRNIVAEITCKVGGSEVVKYLSQRTYGSYETGLLPGFTYTENLGLTGSPSLSIGSISIENINGSRDTWLDYIWANRSCLIKIGDVSWDIADYRIVLNGISNSLTSTDEKTLSLVIQDKLQRLNTPITSAVLGGTTANKDAIIPFTLGECCNITPLLVDPIGPTGTGLYRYHVLPAEGVFEGRAGELPVSGTDDPASATVYPTFKPIGALTLSVQGHKIGGVYTNKIADLVKELAKNSGKVETRFTDGDIDLTQVSTFHTSHQQPIGYYGNSQDNVLSCMQLLAGSVGAQVVCNRSGLMQILTLDKGTSTKTITSTDMEPKSLVRTSMGSLADAFGIDVKAGIVLGYCKNWTVQTGGTDKIPIPQAHIDMFATEWRTVTVKDTTVATDYKLHLTPTREDTYLLTEADATAEANRRLNFWKVPRKIFTFKGLSSCLFLSLGQTITLKDTTATPRYGLASGSLVLVTGLAYDWLTYTVTVTVLV